MIEVQIEARKKYRNAKEWRNELYYTCHGHTEGTLGGIVDMLALDGVPLYTPVAVRAYGGTLSFNPRPLKYYIERYGTLLDKVEFI